MLFYFLLLTVAVCSEFTEKPDNALCFGSLKYDLPVRYLHMQLRNGESNITHSIGPLKVSISGACLYRFSLAFTAGWDQFPKRRVYEAVFDTGIKNYRSEVIDNHDADGSLLYSEYCNCPSKSASDWMHEVGCAKKHLQLDSDLNQWSTIDFEEALKTVREKWANPKHRYSTALCHYQIIDNNLYRKCYGEYTGFRMFVDAAFTSLMRKMYLPNTEFIFNLGDYPLVNVGSEPVPMISWCGSKGTMDIVMPTYELMNSVIDSMESTTLDVHSARGKKYYRWQEKKDTAVFRGRDSCKLRLQVAELSKLYPDLLDAGITRYFFFNESHHTPAVETISFSDFFRHKFVLNIDGTVAAYRFPFLLAGDSVIFKSLSDYYEYFYAELKEKLHYFGFTAFTLIEKIQWARKQDFNETLSAMRQFTLDHLQPLNIFCYYADFVKKYTSKLRQIPAKPADGMELVPKIPPEKRSIDRSCECSQSITHDRGTDKKEEL